MILSRISELVKLEVLDFKLSDLCLSLFDENGQENGSLRQLKTLGRLENLTVPLKQPYGQWGEPEALWILEHWPRLRLLHKIALDDRAVDLLKHRLDNIKKIAAIV